MKILYVTTISDTVNAFLIPHIKMLIKKGHQVDVAFNVVKEVDKELKEIGCRVFNIEFQRIPLNKKNINGYNKIKKIITDENYDIIHTHTPVASFITRFACRNKKNIKIFYTAHGFHFFKGAPLKNWIIYYTLEWLAAKWTDVIITMNDEDFERSKKLNTKADANFKVNGVGIELNKFKFQTEKNKLDNRKKYGYRNEDFILIYVGELSFRKHQDLLINTAKLLGHRIPNLKLLLVGTGDLLENYKKQVYEYGLENTVEFLGYRNDINNLMILSDVSVSSSRQEGLPVNVMEAMATGLPLVVTDCRGNRDLVSHQKNGYIVGIDDSRGFADAIDNLYTSQEKRKTFGQKSSEMIENYSLEKVLTYLEEIYNKNGLI